MKNGGQTSRTYVVEADGAVVAYYALATGSVQRAMLKSNMRHGAPDPVPVLVLSRLAVDTAHQGRGLGGGLLKDALLRTIEVSRSAGVRMLMVHAIDESAAAFYIRHDFQPLPKQPLTLFLPIESAIQAL